ncbi:hypothetical protein ACJ72_04100 [Emergomyces africanus]|uniref:Uncharacterized protein n=1 Tax=Emergomyces africanus TaxID=1955775 RepID=A0A1B7NXQ7_9EURO|nr:hypothetical protein ACJ72_04100 [Emergomyces africanus]
MAKLLFFALVTFPWVLALVDAQGTVTDDSALTPAEVLGNGFSPASPLFARDILDTRQIYNCITVVAVRLAGAAALPNVAPGGRTAAEVVVVSTQVASVVGVAPRARLARPAIGHPGLGDAGNPARTTVPAGGEPSGFSCPPMTVTNSLGDSLELGEDCELKYSSAKPTTTITPPKRPSLCEYEKRIAHQPAQHRQST